MTLLLWGVSFLFNFFFFIQNFRQIPRQMFKRNKKEPMKMCLRQKRRSRSFSLMLPSCGGSRTLPSSHLDFKQQTRKNNEIVQVCSYDSAKPVRSAGTGWEMMWKKSRKQNLFLQRNEPMDSSYLNSYLRRHQGVKKVLKYREKNSNLRTKM